MTDPAILAFIAEQNAQRGQAGVAPDGDGPGGGGVNGVVGEVSASLRGGYNSVILNGGRSQYLLAVDGDGALTLHNAVSGQASHITGASYVLFDGAQTTAPGQYASFLLIADAADSAIAALYQAGFGRVPDFPGLEYWENAYAQGLPLAAIAVDFAQSAEFTRKFGSATGMSATGFATLLYTNILGRAPDPAGLGFWVAQLQAGASRGAVLQGFAASSENLHKIGAATGGWLIDTATGGYADGGVLLPAQTVLTQAGRTNYVNTALIDAASLPPQAAIGAYVIGKPANGAAFISLQGTTPSTVALCPAINVVTDFTAGNVIAGAPQGNSTILIEPQANGPSGSIVRLAGRGNVVALVPGGEGQSSPGNITITGYMPGGDDLQLPAIQSLKTGFGGSAHVPVQIRAGDAGAPLDGNGLDFTRAATVLSLGDVGDGSPATVAAAANAVYRVAGRTGTPAGIPGSAGIPGIASAASAAGENLTFLGQAADGGTVLYQWAAFGPVHLAGTSGFQPMLPIASPDGTGSHRIDAGQLQLLVKLVGVQASSLTAADFS